MLRTSTLAVAWGQAIPALSSALRKTTQTLASGRFAVALLSVFSMPAAIAAQAEVQFSAPSQSSAESPVTLTATVQLSAAQATDVIVPFSLGGDAIDGACGQLVGKLTKSIKGKKLIQHQSIS